jgi:hypothetical protein
MCVCFVCVFAYRMIVYEGAIIEQRITGKYQNAT